MSLALDPHLFLGFLASFVPAPIPCVIPCGISSHSIICVCLVSEEISNCSIREHYVLFGSRRWLTEPDQTHGLLHARPGCSLCLAEAATAAALSAPDSPRDLSFHTHSPFAQHADPSTFCLCLKNSSLRLKTLPVICSLTTGRPADPCLPAQQPVSYSTNVPDSNCARL